MENVMTYGMESKLRLPSCFVEVTDNEMEYLDGGINFWQKAGIIAACVGIMAVVCGLIASGVIVGAAAILKVTVGSLFAKFGVVGVLSVLGFSVTSGIAIAAVLCA